jgi:hypothetical protein
MSDDRNDAALANTAVTREIQRIQHAIEIAKRCRSNGNDTEFSVELDGGRSFLLMEWVGMPEMWVSAMSLTCIHLIADAREHPWCPGCNTVPDSAVLEAQRWYRMTDDDRRGAMNLRAVVILRAGRIGTPAKGSP